MRRQSQAVTRSSNHHRSREAEELMDRLWKKVFGLALRILEMNVQLRNSSEVLAQIRSRHVKRVTFSLVYERRPEDAICTNFRFLQSTTHVASGQLSNAAISPPFVLLQ